MDKNESTEAIHLCNGDQHIVGVKSLRVLLSSDCGLWFAQGLEIDYASSGGTIEEAQVNFETGLKKTVAEHLKLHGSIENLLKIAPQEAWNDYIEADPNALRQKFSTLQFHDLCEDKSQKYSIGKTFPFGNIEFLEVKEAA